MMAISNLYLTHGLMLLCALAAAIIAVPESAGHVVARRRVPTTALLAAISAIALVAYPTWGELKNPALWMFAIVAAIVGVARGHWMQVDVDHNWNLIRLRKAYDSLAATSLMVLLAAIEISLARIGPADQPTMELGMTMLASFLIGRAGAVAVRGRSEPQTDLHDLPTRPVSR